MHGLEFVDPPPTYVQPLASQPPIAASLRSLNTVASSEPFVIEASLLDAASEASAPPARPPPAGVTEQCFFRY